MLLADLMTRNKGSQDMDFYDQSTVQRLIDRQFPESAKLMAVLLYIYMLGFLVPFIVGVSLSHNRQANNRRQNTNEISAGFITTQTICLSSCLLTQIFFFYLEFAELDYEGWEEYFFGQEWWNFMDSTQLVFFCIHMAFQIHEFRDQMDTKFDMVNNCVEIVLLVEATFKILQYLRFKDNFRQLIRMFLAVFLDLWPFMTLFLSLICFFAMIQVIMEVDACKSNPGPDGYFTKGCDYLHISQFFRLFLHTFRISVGDIHPPNYQSMVHHSAGKSAPSSEEASTHNVSIYIIWFFWFCNVFIMMIIMLNFLIAEVGQTYQKIQSKGQKLHYQQRADLNLLTQKIKKLFNKLVGHRTKYKVLIFSGQKQELENHDLELFSFIGAVRTQVQETSWRMTRELMHKQKGSFARTQELYDASIDKLQAQIEQK